MTYSPEILAAVELLDKDQPGWHRKIDLGIFTLAGFDHCVCGQVYGVGPAVFRQTMDRLGFDYSDEKKPTDMVFARPVYQPEWRSLISERQTADKEIAASLAVEEPEEVFA